MENKFQLVSKYSPTGDQPQAIEKLVDGINNGLKSQVLLGVTGSGKTFTMANVIAKTGRSALVLAHNKTLAAQLCNEFREFFPHNRVEFFVSYYDYYQPEAYIVSTDTYIEKDMSINDEIDKLRHSATASLIEADDVIVVSSVSCIYGLGAPEEYYGLAVSLREGQQITPKEVVRRLVNIQYERNDIDFKRSTFRFRGDTIEIFPASSTSIGIRVEFFGDEIEKISEFDVLTGKVQFTLTHAMIFPATHYAVGSEKLKNVLTQIENDMHIQVDNFTKQNKLIEAQRLQQRVSYDLEMMNEMGYCNGIENYSRYFDGRKEGQPPYTLLDYFKKDFILFIDESHITVPQIRGMYNGDRARKQSLVEYGFRLTSAFDNRPLNFEEFNNRIGQVIYVSATPAEYELKLADEVVEQIIRPTGLLDPVIEVRKTENQIDNLIDEIKKVTATDGRILVTTLTKKMAESLTKYLTEFNINVRYLHSDIDTMERVEIVNSLRSGDFDVLIGINLLREGLDIPEVKLVAILDADKEGFLRSESSLVQIVGRAARNSEAKVIMYADTITRSMKNAIEETNRRRKIQSDYNTKHNIIPKTIYKEIKNTLEISKKQQEEVKLTPQQRTLEIEKLTTLMNLAASSLDFEQAILLRNEIAKLKQKDKK